MKLIYWGLRNSEIKLITSFVQQDSAGGQQIKSVTSYSLKSLPSNQKLLAKVLAVL